jgi:hypothetical protein
MSSIWVALASMLVSLATLAGAIYTARSARAAARPRDAREDFEAITTSLRADVGDLRAQLVEERRTRREQVAAERRARGVLVEYVRGLVRQMRDAGLEPAPPPPELHEV